MLAFKSHFPQNPIPNITTIMSFGASFQCFYAGLNSLHERNLMALDTVSALGSSFATQVIAAGAFIGLTSSAISLVTGKAGISQMPGLVLSRGFETAFNCLIPCLGFEGAGMAGAVFMKHESHHRPWQHN